MDEWSQQGKIRVIAWVMIGLLIVGSALALFGKLAG